MRDSKYTASKSRTQGRNAWAVTFRHPVCRDDEGRQGVKVRRGLGTSDESTADALVEDMNALLSDQTYWNIAERSRAEQRFDNRVVRAFYEPMESPVGVDPVAIRDDAMPLPTKEDGYSRVMFMGTTGAGKTSLLRHLIGTDPRRDRFPSTSTGKTTIADIEVITASGDLEAVVTFFPRRLIRTYVAESVLEACKTAWRDGPREQIARDLLNHKEQRFRLGYLLGSWLPAEQDANEDDWGEQDAIDTDEVELDSATVPTAEERVEMQQNVEVHLERICGLAESAGASLSQELGEPLEKLNGDDLEAAIELFLEQVEKLPSYSELVDAIAGQVLSRFDVLRAGTLTKRGGWPEKWSFRSSDRDEFIRQIRWFSSNHHQAYGRLLTPVVQGIRVKGPFASSFGGDVPRWVLIDGEGLGHTPESAASVSTHYTSRYRSVDVILLVDNAKQPMQAAPLSVLRSVATSGHHEKLAIAFTHFDAVKGDNLPGYAEKRNHVLASVRNSLNGLRDAIGDIALSGLERQIDDRCFMLGWLDQPATKVPGGARRQLALLTDFFEDAIAEPPPPAARPAYDPAGLAFAVQAAAGDFHSLWDARLGYRHLDGVSKEHWSRVKALNRRVALRMDNYEYQHLMPVAELIARLAEAISRFLDAPTRWDAPAMDDNEATAAIARIRAEVHTALHSFAMERVIEGHLADWGKAFAYAGPGSTYDRAQVLREIYGEAAPVPGVEFSEVASQFLSSVRKLVVHAIRNGGGDLVLQDA